jgi:hypothetical protein
MTSLAMDIPYQRGDFHGCLTFRHISPAVHARKAGPLLHRTREEARYSKKSKRTQRARGKAELEADSYSVAQSTVLVLHGDVLYSKLLHKFTAELSSSNY